jgi:hypothetical protein
LWRRLLHRPGADARGGRGRAQIGVLQWFARLWEIDQDEYWGYITNCGTEGNLHGILVGRENLPDGVLYASRETHYSVFKCAARPAPPCSCTIPCSNARGRPAQPPLLLYFVFRCAALPALASALLRVEVRAEALPSPCARCTACRGLPACYSARAPIGPGWLCRAGACARRGVFASLGREAREAPHVVVLIASGKGVQVSCKPWVGAVHGRFCCRPAASGRVRPPNRPRAARARRAARMYRMDAERLDTLPSGEVDYDHLRSRLAANAARPAIINVNVGTTVKGAVDDLDRVLEILAETGYGEDRFYIHCDGALFGLMVRDRRHVCPESAAHARACTAGAIV